jgi:hypothetical protein
MQMDDQFQALFSPHRRFAEHDAYVQYAQTAHFEKIAQQFGAAPLQRIRRDMVQFHDVVGNQPVTARDQPVPSSPTAPRRYDTPISAHRETRRGVVTRPFHEVVADQPHQVHAGLAME